VVPAPRDRTGDDSYPLLGRHVPVLVRGAGVLQVGVDQDPSLVLEGMAPGMRQLLALVDGCHSRRALDTAAVALGIPVAHLAWTLQTLSDAGLVTEGRPSAGVVSPPLARSRIRLVGAGALGRAVAELLVASRPEVMYVVDEEPPDPALYPGSTWATQAQALQTHLGESAGGRVRVVNHWSKPEERRPDLTVLACDRLECDREVGDALVQADQPHLVLRVRAGGVVVGPLVVPGLTACLRCTDLSRRDVDPKWPMLLPQLMHLRVPPVPALVGWAAGVAAAQALSYLSGQATDGRSAVPETWGATLEVAPGDFLTRRRVWSMHPRCGCGWSHAAH
jgi:hypothetical protein